MAEVGLSDAPKAHDTAGTDSKSGQPQAVEVRSVVRAPSDGISSVKAIGPQEDWLHAATADPAFWLKEVS